MLAVVCVEVGNYRGLGERYVEALRRGVKAHLSVPYHLYCISERPHDNVGWIPSHPFLTGWYQKMEVFRKNIVPEERIIFLDLDCIITGSLNRLAACEERLAVSPDFFRPQYKDSAVMVLQTGECSDIWDRYCSLGMPQNLWRGDAQMLELAPYAKNLNALYPNIIGSFKLGCAEVVPEGTAIVSFHGEPKPDQMKSTWAAEEWKRLTQPLEELHGTA